MANRGDSYIITLKKSHLEWGTHRYTGTRDQIYGEGYIYDILGDYKFKISPLSFYQVNPVQAEKLYNLGVEMAQISKNDTVFDLYCGNIIGIYKKGDKYVKGKIKRASLIPLFDTGAGSREARSILTDRFKVGKGSFVSRYFLAAKNSGALRMHHRQSFWNEKYIYNEASQRDRRKAERIFG